MGGKPLLSDRLSFEFAHDAVGGFGVVEFIAEAERDVVVCTSGGDVTDVEAVAGGRGQRIQFGEACLRTPVPGGCARAVVKLRGAAHHRYGGFAGDGARNHLGDDAGSLIGREVRVTAYDAYHRPAGDLKGAALDEPRSVAELQARPGEGACETAETTLQTQGRRFVGAPKRRGAKKDDIRLKGFYPSVDAVRQIWCGPDCADERFD